ncbi:hypothetical protein AM593_03509, partial [Mytilus galloprovincialis]
MALDKTFTADINTNAALSWTTSLTDFFSVRQPVNLEIIYEVQGGSIIPNFEDSKYIFDNMSQDVKDIHITVIRVNTTDAGLYSADTGGKIDGCCLLIVTDGPENVVVEPAITNLNVTEGTTLGPLYCYATCNPVCNYNWKQKWTGTFNPVSNEYLINEGRGVRIQAINRNSPKITDIWFSSDKQRNEVRTPAAFSFNEEENVKMTLRVKSNPESQITFKSSLLKIQRRSKGNGYIDYTSYLPSLQCEDSGNFSILASNGIPYADTSKPRNVSSESRTLGAKIGSVENIVLHVISFPAPNVKWKRVTGFPWKIEKDRYDYRHKIHSKIRIRSEVDFGVYGIN